MLCDFHFIGCFMNETNQYRYVLEKTLGIPFTEHNRVDVLLNGNEIFPAMLESIRQAEKQVNFLTFVYWSGQVAEDFAAAFARKAKEGVNVRVLLDAYGAAFMLSEISRLMIDNGVEVRWFRPFTRWKVWEMDNRSHRKILVCDGSVGFTGGVGIAEEWEGNARDPSEYRDTHFRIRGGSVRGLQAAFMENWIETEDFLPLNANWKEDIPSRSDRYGVR